MSRPMRLGAALCLILPSLVAVGCDVTASAYVQHSYYVPDQPEPIDVGAQVSWTVYEETPPARVTTVTKTPVGASPAPKAKVQTVKKQIADGVENVLK